MSKPSPVLPLPPWTLQQCYQFDGTLQDPDEPHQSLSFIVLAGDGGATPTGGWAKINTIDRARRKGFTMPVGYDPASMDIPIRFAGSTRYDTTTAASMSPTDVESAIQKLEWMAGRGKLYANGTHPTHGDPPIVQVSSFRTDGSQTTATNLIPPNWHSNGVADLRWLISNINYDSSPVREGDFGNRRVQTATVSVVEYVAAPGAPSSPRERQKARGTDYGVRVYHAKAGESIARICINAGIKDHKTWRLVMQFNEARLHVHNVNKPLKAGSEVQILKTYFPSR